MTPGPRILLGDRDPEEEQASMQAEGLTGIIAGVVSCVAAICKRYGLVIAILFIMANLGLA